MEHLRLLNYQYDGEPESMKLMYVGCDKTLLERIEKLFVQNRYEYIHYKDPLKALNNILEIQPDVLVFNEADFQKENDSFHRILENSSLSKEMVALFLSPYFKNEKKSLFYFINSDLDNNKNIDFLNHAISQSLNSADDRIQFIMTHPLSKSYLFGRIDYFDESHFSIIPNFPDSAASILEGSEIPCCTILTKKEAFNFSAVLVENQSSMKFSIDKKLAKKILKSME